MLSVCSPVAGVVIMEKPSRCGSGRVVRPVHRGAAGLAGQIIRLALLEKRVVFVAIAPASRGPQSRATRAEIILLLEVMGRVG